MKTIMKTFAAAAVVAALGLGASAQQNNPLTGQPMQGQQAQPAPAPAPADGLIKSVTLADLERLARSGGGTVEDAQAGDGNPYVVAKDSETGLRYALYGTACNAGSCSGIEMAATWAGTAYNTDMNRINEWNLSKAAVSVGVQSNNDGSKSVLVSRYLILDFGQTFENLELNLTVFKSIASGLGAEFSADPSQRTGTPGGNGGGFQQ